MAKNSNFSILADVELDLTSIKEQLKKTKITFDIDGKSIKIAGQSLDELAKDLKKVDDANEKAKKSTEDLTLTFQEANLIMQKSIDIISSMVEQTFNLDSALTEFKKVSDLSGDSLDEYVDKLSEMGNSVARTGKPNRSEPVCCDGKAA